MDWNGLDRARDGRIHGKAQAVSAATNIVTVTVLRSGRGRREQTFRVFTESGTEERGGRGCPLSNRGDP